MQYPGVEVFKTALTKIESYELPDSTNAKALACALPDYMGNHARRLRFLIKEHGVAFDILPPGPDINEDSCLVVQLGKIPDEQADFPDGNLDKIFDSQLQLKDNRPYMLHARYDLYKPEHAQLLTRAGLGGLVVAHLRPSFGIGAPYGDYIDLGVVEHDVPWLPYQLYEITNPLQ